MMFEFLEINAIQKIKVIQILINQHTEIADSFDETKRLIVKEFYSSSSITKMYAILEDFINTIISDYLDILSEIKKFDELSNELKKEYRIGISHVLSKLEHRKYKHLNHENVVKWYYEAIHNHSQYKFVTEALTRQEENYRLDAIIKAFTRIDLDDFHSWVSHYPLLTNTKTQNENIDTSLDSKIKQFIDLRNEASHGIVENLPSESTLIHNSETIILTIKLITSYFRKSIIALKKEALYIGKLTEYFKKHDVYILTCAKGKSINVNSKVLFLNHNDCDICTIQSIQDNDQQLNNITIPQDNYELGIKFNMPVPKNSEIYIL